MLSAQLILPIHRSINVDLFAGGGGASLGSEMALGRHVDIAVNHNPVALSIHKANHPQTTHYISDVFEVDPKTAAKGQPVGFLWASPDCRHFSRAKGGVPVSEAVRGLAWVIRDWARDVRPSVIAGENVPEMLTWGPLDETGHPMKAREGETFKEWVAALEALGYVFEYRVLTASDFGAPTIRKRLYFIARCDGNPIVWPKPTHSGPGKDGKIPAGYKRWKTAGECIDFTIPCPSIFERKKDLADATCRRIAKGIMRYVVNAADPYLVENARVGEGNDHSNKVAAFIMKNFTGVVGSDLRNPMPTVTAVDHNSLVVASLVHLGHGEGKCGKKRFSHGVRSLDEPLNTITASGAPAGLVVSHLVKLRGQNVGSDMNGPLHTISAQGTHHAEVRAFLVKWYGEDQDKMLDDSNHSVTTNDSLVTFTIRGENYAIADIGLRMLTPRELYRAQSFPDSYVIDRDENGTPITKTNQIKMVGNSVCPVVAKAIIESNHPELTETHQINQKQKMAA